LLGLRSSGEVPAATHRVPLGDAPRAYEMFQKKEDGAVKVVLSP
jgi:threonine dehydrogenase-like Zn-dependent dehydrogenase